MCPGIGFLANKLCWDAVNDKINENQLIEKKCLSMFVQILQLTNYLALLVQI